MLRHPTKDLEFQPPYFAGEPLGEAEANALNALKLQQAMEAVKARSIGPHDEEEFIRLHLAKAEVLMPKQKRKRTPLERKAREIIIAAIKNRYREKGMPVTGAKAAIEGLADQIEASNNETWQKALLAAESDVKGFE